MRTTALSVALLVLAVPAYAQTAPTGKPQQNMSAMDSATQQFVQKAAISDMYEIQAGQIAKDKSSTQQIDQFAQQMIDDHTKVSKEMTGLVQKMQGMEIPKQLDAEHQKKLDALKSAANAQFDREYRTQQIDAHKTAVNLFTDYSKNGTNAELKSWAEKTLPHLQKHLEMAQALPQNTQAPGMAQNQDRSPNQAQMQNQNQAQQRATNMQSQGKILARPAAGQILGTDLMGTTVYGSNNEDIGEISDALIDRDGRVVAVIVGVGGFLGIGEKDVAIPFSALERITDNRNTTGQGGAAGTMKPDRIVLKGMTKADLEAAPNFDADDDDNNNNAPNSNTNRR